ncbi:iron reductase [Limosilactobacillus fermentum]
MLTRRKYLLGLAWVVAIFVIPLPFIQTLNAGLPAIYSSEKMAIIFGSIAYSWMLLAIYIGTKPKWLDRLIGLPSAYMLHGILSIAAIVLAYLHKTGSPSGGLIKLTGDWAFDLFVGLAIYSLVFMAGWLTSRVKPLAMLKKQLSKKIFKHEVSVWIHKLNLVATVLVFIHVMLISYIRAIAPFMFTFYLYGAFVLVAYLISLRPDRGVGAILANNVEISPRVQELSLQLTKPIDTKAGDFVFLSFPKIAKMKEPHPFSVVSAPNQNREMVLAIRGDGDFTKNLATVEPGAEALVNGGYGLYQTTIDNVKPTHMIIIAGGIGVVPMLSIVDANPDIDTTFFYNAHAQNNLLYPEKFARWEQRDNFTDYLQVGRFDDETILNTVPRDLSKLVVLIGGPAPMGRHWVKLFSQLGLNSGQIYYEEFSW